MMALLLPFSPPNEYIMVLNALGGVNGRSRAIMHCSEVDQY